MKSVLELAKEAELYDIVSIEYEIEYLERFAALVAAHEREACAKLLEDAAYTGRIISCTSAAKAIRARSEK